MHLRWTIIAIALVLSAVIYGCSSESENGEHRNRDSLSAGKGEHDRDGNEHGMKGRSEEGEESGVELALTQTYDKTRNGARLILAYDASSNAFVGTVQNTTTGVLKQVRVEVHLSNGKELGPTTPATLEPGQAIDVKLTAAGKGFERWNAHPEVGSGEHGHGEGHGEHGREGGAM